LKNKNLKGAALMKTSQSKEQMILLSDSIEWTQYMIQKYQDRYIVRPVTSYEFELLSSAEICSSQIILTGEDLDISYTEHRDLELAANA
jgi:hypothetical protein